MKKILILLLVLVIVLSLAGCGVKEKIENKVDEAVSEKLIENLGGGNVDISGDKVTIKGENGAEVTLGSTEWPKSDLVKNIPEFKDGTIVSVMDSESYSLIVVEKVKEPDFVKYRDDIKKNFTEDAFEMNSEEVLSFGSGNGKGFNVQVSYERSNETLTISASKVE